MATAMTDELHERIEGLRCARDEARRERDEAIEERNDALGELGSLRHEIETIRVVFNAHLDNLLKHIAHAMKP